MRKQFIEVATRYLAAKQCPWARVIAKVVDGYMTFESQDDYFIWKRQK